MAAPVVQSLAEIIAELNPGVQGQTTLIEEQRAALAPKYEAQKSALTAEKGRGFDVISDQARGRGMAFSGVPLDEQATYLSTKYLPGLQAADAAMNQEDVALRRQGADIQADLSKTAFGTRQQQTSDLNSWNMQEASLAAQAEQARLEREQRERMAAADRSFQASQAALSRAASAKASAPKAVSPDNAALSIIGGAVGGDGFVSPSTFQLARDYYVQAGGKASDFATKYWKYTGAGKGQANESRWKSYYYG